MPTVMDAIKLGTKTGPEIKRNIEKLGQLNDRYEIASAAQDRKQLRQLANEYEQIGCPRKANEIREEARAIRRKKAHTTTKGDVDITRDGGAGSGPASMRVAV